MTINGMWKNSHPFSRSFPKILFHIRCNHGLPRRSTAGLRICHFSTVVKKISTGMKNCSFHSYPARPRHTHVLHRALKYEAGENLIKMNNSAIYLKTISFTQDAHTDTPPSYNDDDDDAGEPNHTQSNARSGWGLPPWFQNLLQFVWRENRRPPQEMGSYWNFYRESGYWSAMLGITYRGGWGN